MSFVDLDIYKTAHEVAIQIHKMTLTKLPKFEISEEGKQIRRSSKSVKSNIVEGYGRRKYKNDFIKFLIYAIASNDETKDHLRNLYECGSYTDKIEYEKLREKLNTLGKQMYKFLITVEKTHISSK